MFNSLDEEIKRDDESTVKQRWIRYSAVLVLSLVLFGGLYAGVRFLE